MDDNFKTIYRILTAFERSLDIEAFDLGLISAEKLGISKIRLYKYLEMLIEVEYIGGIEIEVDIADTISINAGNPHITLKGLEYLSENSIMQRIYKTAKGIKGLVK